MATAPATGSDFLELLTKSGLIDPKQVDIFLSKLPDGLPNEPREIASIFVRTGLLTGFQANQLLAGKYRGFFLGKYKLMEILGTGGMGSVFLAEQLAMRRLVAVKVLPHQATKDRSVLERFMREARAAAALNHPNIVRAYDMDTDGRSHFLVMEYVEGINLHQLLERVQNIPVERVAHIIRQAATGLQCIHENKLIHRDIKPGNLLMDRAGTIRILDLGLARFSLDDDKPLTKELDGNKVLGTADFLAPEQAMSSHDVDIRADIYSLGATMYYLLAGKAPFHGSTVVQKLMHHQVMEPPSISRLRSDVPPEMLAVLQKMMAKDPGHRYATPKDIVEALSPWTGGPMEPPTEKEIPKKLQPMLGLGNPSTGPQTRSVRANPPSRSIPIPEKGTSSGDSSLATNVVFPQQLPGTNASAAPSKILSNVSPQARTLPERRSPRTPLFGVLAACVLGGGVALWYFTKSPSDNGALAKAGDPKSKAGEEVKKGEPAKREEPKGPPPFTVKQVAQAPIDSKVATCVALASNNSYVALPGDKFQVQLLRGSNLAPGRMLPGHEAKVNALAFATSNKLLASGGDDNAVAVWDPETGEKLSHCEGHAGHVTAVAFSRDNKLVLSGSADKTVRAWKVEDGKQLSVFKDHKADVTALTAVGQGSGSIVSGAIDGTIHVSEAATGKPLRKYKLDKPILKLTTVRNNDFVAVTENETVAFNPGRDEPIARFPNAGANATTGESSHDGRFYLEGTADGKIRLLDVAAGNVLCECPLNAGGVTDMAISSEGTHLVSVGKDNKVTRWELPQPVATVSAYPTFNGGKSISQVAVSGDAKWVATAGGDDKLRLHERAGARSNHVLAGHTGIIRGVAWLPGSKRAASVSDDGSIRLWDADRQKAEGIFAQTEGPLHSVAVSPNGNYLLTTGLETRARLWNIANRTPSRWLGPEGATMEPLLAAFLGNGDRVVTAEQRGKKIRVFQTETGTLLKTITAPRWINGIVPTPDGKSLYHFDGVYVQLTDLESGQTVQVTGLPDNQTGIRSLAVSPNGNWLAIGTSLKKVYLYHVPSARIAYPMTEAAGNTNTALLFAKDGLNLYVGDAGGTTRVARLQGILSWFERVGMDLAK